MTSEYQKRKKKIDEMHKILDECKRNGGIAQYGEKGALEIVLKYVFKKQNYSELSDELLKRFDSIEEILSAELDDLYSVKGLGKASARHFFYIGDIFRFEHSEKPTPDSFATLNSSVEFCIRAFRTYSREALFVAYIDEHNHPVLLEEIFKKLSSITTFDMRNILYKTIQLNVSKILLTHNHPNELPFPSSQDIASTKRIAFLFRQLGINLIDHIIIGGKLYYSFRKIGYFDEILD